MPPVWVGMDGKLREKGGHAQSKIFGRGRRLITGSDNLLAGVCALISYEYSHFGAESCQ